MATKAQLKATQKYNKENYDRIEIQVPKGNKEIIDKRAKELDKTRNQYIIELINKDLKTK